jgi:uncharacterized protein with ParB-like and HNH nuclease domain
MATKVESQVPKTLRELFEKRRSIGIPVYQRAYSWKREQWQQFWEDLKEQAGKPYHLGLFLFEKDGDKNLVIDGQQRLTTCVLFFAALAKVYKSKGESANSLALYLSEGAFSTINDDNAYFRQLIQSQQVSNSGSKATTLSQQKLREAFEFFVKEIEKAHKKDGGVSRITQMQKSLEDANIGVFDIADKGVASQVFEYQNKRGIKASDFEVIKAYLIHQVYVSQSPDIARHIDDIEDTISHIYRNFEQLDGYFSEDNFLDCYFYLFDLSNEDDWRIKSIKGYFLSDNEKITGDAACQWVTKFFHDFRKLTDAAVHLVERKNKPNIANLFLIGDKPYWRAVMLAVIIKDKIDDDKLCRLAKLLEVLWFKLEVSDHRRRSDRFTEKVYEYFHDSGMETLSFDSLCQYILRALDKSPNENWEEFSGVTATYIKSSDHFGGGYKYATKYVLWQYENFLRQKARQEILTKRSLFENYTVEHIHPQSSEHGYVGNLGNLSLLTQSDNSTASDKSFEEKKSEVYKKYFDMTQNTGKLFLYSKILPKESWRTDEVESRFRKIREFVTDYFDGEACKKARAYFEKLHKEHEAQVKNALKRLGPSLSLIRDSLVKRITDDGYEPLDEGWGKPVGKVYVYLWDCQEGGCFALGYYPVDDSTDLSKRLQDKLYEKVDDILLSDYFSDDNDKPAVDKYFKAEKYIDNNISPFDQLQSQIAGYLVDRLKALEAAAKDVQAKETAKTKKA